MKKASNVTELLKRRSKNIASRSIDVEIGDLVLHGELLKIPHVMDIMDSYDTTTKTGGFAMALELIYLTFPIFRDKEMLEQNNCAEPHDIVLEILSINEVTELINKVNSAYGLSDNDDVKKQ